MESPAPRRRPQRDLGSANLVVLLGTVTSEVTQRQLADGTEVAQFDLTTRIDDGGGKICTVSLPLAWHDPTAAGLTSVALDARVAVVGTVRRRFFRSGGATQSRTEVVVQRVIPAHRTKSVRSMLAAVASDLIQVIE
jgi:single-strand DNA-binding protein